jgi:transglutaminase-like putative cysteine protease
LNAICDYVHNRITFGYAHASPTRTAWDADTERRGVCRNYAHLAVTLCRCMNIPARYCTGHLGDIGVPLNDAPMDFSAWFEAYLGGRWYTCDARHNKPRIGRILMARGRDATASASFGFAKQNTTKALSSRRTEYVSGVADRTPAAQNITSLFLRPRTFSAGSAT